MHAISFVSPVYLVFTVVCDHHANKQGQTNHVADEYEHMHIHAVSLKWKCQI